MSQMSSSTQQMYQSLQSDPLCKDKSHKVVNLYKGGKLILVEQPVRSVSLQLECITCPLGKAQSMFRACHKSYTNLAALNHFFVFVHLSAVRSKSAA